MTQEDIVLADDNWTAIACPGTEVHLLAIYNGDISVRLGSGSTSNGLELFPGDTLSASESIYVKVKKAYLSTVRPSISVAR